MRSLEFDPAGFEDLAWWVEQDRAQALEGHRRRACPSADSSDSGNQLDPFKGIGKPEPLRHDLSGCWSRWINQEHRLVYQVQADKIRILACRFHY